MGDRWISEDPAKGISVPPLYALAVISSCLWNRCWDWHGYRNRWRMVLRRKKGGKKKRKTERLRVRERERERESDR